MKYFLFALLLGSMVPFTAKADMLLEEHHPVDSCLIIDNLSEHADYTFFVHEKYKFASTIELDEEGVCGIDGEGYILAVKNTDLSKLDRSIDPNSPESEGNWPDRDANASYIRSADISIPFAVQVPDVDPTTKEVYVVNIGAFEENFFNADFVSLTRTDEDGNVITGVDADKKLLNNAALAIGVVGILGLLLTTKRWKK